MLNINNITKRYRNAGEVVEALSDISFDLSAGETLVIRGPSGCGKTTLLLTVGGLLAPDNGVVRNGGDDLYALSPAQRAQLRATRIGFIFQQFHLIPYLTVLENVLTASLPAAPGQPGDPLDRAHELIRRFGLTDRSHHVPSQLSTGERQRTALARALLNRPQLLLADEPTGNLDEENAEIVLTHLSEFARDGGAVILATHDTSAMTEASQTIHLKHGRQHQPEGF